MIDPKIFAQNEVLRIRNEIEALDRSFPATPDGHLKCSKRGGRKCYYIVKTEGGVRRARYIPADQMDIAEAMAMRDYLTRKRRLLEQDLKCMEILPECYSGRCGIDAAESMNPDHFALIKDSVFPAEDENRWMQVLMMQTDNTEFDYTGDFQKILESIRNEKDSAVYYRTTTTINIRSAPDETDDTNKLGKVPENTVVKADLTGEVNERWVKVTYTAEDGSSIDGWVSKDYVEQTQAPEPEAETE